MDIFIVENNIIKPSQHALLIEPFSNIWERDSSPKKEEAIRDYTFIELMGSLKKSNVFAGYSKDERRVKTLEYLSKVDEYTPDGLVEECLLEYIRYRDEASPTASFYEAALNGAKKMETFFNTFDLDDRTNNGGLVLKPGDITRALKDSQQVLQSLTALKAKVQSELFESAKTRNDKQINPFEQ